MGAPTPSPSPIAKLLIRPEDSIRQALRCIDNGVRGIVLVTDSEGRLVGTLTDGDFRRALLANHDLDAPVVELLEKKAFSPYPAPITAPVGTSPDELISLMATHDVRQVPILDDQRRVVDLVALEDLLPPLSPPAMQAVIMAGGFGTRLMPLTEDVPKPMLPVGGRPLMEHVVEQLRRAGIRHVNVTTFYKPEKIVEHFGDGHAFGVDMHYVNEDRPLGTGGALGLMSPPAETQLVINGDILTQVDFRAMLAFHQENKAELTVAVRRYEMQVQYGVLECDGARVSSLKEKPKVGFLVNAGIYLLEPSVYQLIPAGESFHMTDIIQWLLDAGRPVISFPIREYWIDVGQHGDYAQAQADMQTGTIIP